MVEASWYGDRTPGVGLGGAFHSRRLRLVSSQVGPRARRAARALEQPAADGGGAAAAGRPGLDVLISGETAFRDLERRYPEILDRPDTLCHRVSYE